MGRSEDGGDLLMSAMAQPSLERLAFRPASPYPYDLEIFRLSDLKRRSTMQAMRRTYSYEFCMFILVTEGNCTHFVDFEPVACSEGSLLILQSGQAHNFGSDDDWDGWMMLARPEFAGATECRDGEEVKSSALERLPGYITLSSQELKRAVQDIQYMQEDALTGTEALKMNSGGKVAEMCSPGQLTSGVQKALYFRFRAMMSWLNMLHGQPHPPLSQQPRLQQRFQQFQTLVEERFREWSQLSDYAVCLGCTEKSLTRATLAVTGISAKAYLSRRIVLEARRLLKHTRLPVATLAGQLGFAGTDRFCKFFKRETRITPTEFRKREGAERM